MDNSLSQRDAVKRGDPETIQVATFLPRELWDEVKIIAIRRRTTAQQFTIDALRSAVDQDAAEARQ